LILTADVKALSLGKAKLFLVSNESVFQQRWCGTNNKYHLSHSLPISQRHHPKILRPFSCKPCSKSGAGL